MPTECFRNAIVTLIQSMISQLSGRSLVGRLFRRRPRPLVFDVEQSGPSCCLLGVQTNLFSKRRHCSRTIASMKETPHTAATQPTKKKDTIDPSLSAFLLDEMKIDVQLHPGIIRALQSAYGKHVKVSDLKSFGKTGLEALAVSVEQELQKRRGTLKRRPSVMVHFAVPHHSTEFDLKWKLGESLLDVAHSIRGEELLREYMEGTCGGQMSCCSCHVYLDELLYSELDRPSEGEKDMLDLAYEYRKGQSRLGCQVKLHSELLQKLEKSERVTVTIPAGVNNIWK